MKKLVFIFLLKCLLMPMFAHAQFGINPYEVVVANSNTPVYQKWFRISGEMDAYYWCANFSPVGIKNVIEKAKIVLNHNGLSFYEPYLDKSLLYSTVNGIDDYQGIYSTASIDFTSVVMIWQKDGWMLSVYIEKDMAAIIVQKRN